jgi:NAD(P)H-hydrate epimerase
MRVFNRAQMQEADRRTIEDIGLPASVLMEHAGRAVVAAMASAFEPLEGRRVAVLCGPGNNGGDGFVAARMLSGRGVRVGVYLAAAAEQVRGEARANLAALDRLGIDVIEIDDAGAWERHGADVLAADVIVDALFGTGLRSPLAGVVETVVADVNASAVPVVSVDLPSGLFADSARVPGPAIEAALTVALGAPKLPLVLPPAEALTGTLVVADIGIPASVLEEVGGPRVELLTREALAPLVAPRAPDSHKGDYGRVLIVAGSVGKAGAGALAGLAALRSGAGLVTVATPVSCVPVVASFRAELMTLPLRETPAGAIEADAVDVVLAADADVIAAGPGLGRDPSTRAFVHALVERADRPLVLDADAIQALAGAADRLTGRRAATIVTPHPGEMAALTGRSVQDVQANRLEVARDVARAHGLHVVLKGHRTIVAAPDGRAFVNTTGNPGMATAGSGDALLGMIAAWCGQLGDPGAAARLAVHLHGAAGDLAAAATGEVAMVAGDIIDRLGEAMATLSGRDPRPTTS